MQRHSVRATVPGTYVGYLRKDTYLGKVRTYVNMKPVQPLHRVTYVEVNVYKLCVRCRTYVCQYFETVNRR